MGGERRLETATFSFQPMVKMWRDVLHECASEMQTTSESIEIEDVMDENGDPMKFCACIN